MRLLTPIALLATTASAANLIIKIAQPTYPFDASALPSSTHATLYSSGIPLNAPLSVNNTFHFSGIKEDSYALTIHALEWGFEPLRIDVFAPGNPEGVDEIAAAAADGGKTDEGGKVEGRDKEHVKAWQSFYGHEWDNKGESRLEWEAWYNNEFGEVTASVVVNPIGIKKFYAERQGFSALSLFKNPMILIALFSLAVIVGMPYLLENMDPDMKAEFEAMQKEQASGKGAGAIASNPAAAMQNFDLAGWMAGSGGSGSGQAEAAAEGGETAKQGGVGGNGGGKKRKG